MRALKFSIAGALVVAAAATARADDAAAAAEQLFRQGRDLVARRDYAAACPKFEASWKLDPALGTLLNLASCYEKSDRLASAWARYREAADLAGKRQEKQRQQFAAEHADALEKRLPRLVVTVAAQTAGTHVVVSRNGVAVDDALIGTEMFVDPGDHEIVATADGRSAYSTKLTVAERQRREVSIPALAPVGIAAAQSPASAAAPATAGQVQGPAPAPPPPGRPLDFDIGGGTAVPVLIGAQATLAPTPRVRVQLEIGWMPPPYVEVVNTIVVEAGGHSAEAGDLVVDALQNSAVVRLSGGVRPFLSHGFELYAGYTAAFFGGGLSPRDSIEEQTGEDFADPGGDSPGSSQVPVHSTLQAFHVSAGWCWELPHHLRLRAQVGYLQAFASSTTLDTERRSDLADAADGRVESALDRYLDDIYKSSVKTPVVSLTLATRL